MSDVAPVPPSNPLVAAAGLARFAVGASWRLTAWAVTTSISNTVRVANAVVSGQSPAKILSDATADFRVTAVRLLGLDPPQPRRRASASAAQLRARGAALLYDSADVWYEDDTHPAFAKILDELIPDEARILRFLSTEGPQPSVDVRTHPPLGVGSELVVGGLSMIGLQAGVRNVEQTKADLDNLNRLGLIWFSREQVKDPSVYQVVEVQPDVTDATKKAGRSVKVVHRSIHLTSFGEEFCDTCIPLNGDHPVV